jgi:hypothetical protein
MRPKLLVSSVSLPSWKDCETSLVKGNPRDVEKVSHPSCQRFFLGRFGEDSKYLEHL